MKKDCEKRLQEIIGGFKKCQNAFTALGDEIRQSILLLLLQSDLTGIRVGKIAAITRLTRPTVSHHMRILKDAGIVAVRREGTKNYYYLSADHTLWKEIFDLVNLVYESVLQIQTEIIEKDGGL